MPVGGVPWTLRKGIIAGHGTYPEDIESPKFEKFIDKSKEEIVELTRMLAPNGTRQLTLSDCGINPGDSGGPIVDESGEVVV